MCDNVSMMTRIFGFHPIRCANIMGNNGYYTHDFHNNEKDRNQFKRHSNISTHSIRKKGMPLSKD